jgi:hypothetical protein
MKVLNLKILMKQKHLLAQQFYLPVKKTLYFWNFIAIENTVLLNGMMLKMMLLNK